MKNKTARITVLVDPSRKLEFERVCRQSELTPSQVLRQLIREFVEGAGKKKPAPKPRK